MKFKFCIFFLVFIFSGLIAQEPRTHELEPLILDSLRVKDNLLSADSLLRLKPITDNNLTERKYAPDFKRRYQGQEFDYERKLPKKSLRQRLNEFISKVLRSIFGDINFASTNSLTLTALKIFAVILLSFLLYLLIRYLLGKDGRWLLSKKNTLNLQDELLDEDIHEINFSEKIEIAEKAADYRSAIRYYFLFVLKTLTDKKQIEWNPEKTNKDYIKELSHEEVQADFRKVARIFDYVWYGEFSLDQKQYSELRKNFEKLTK